MSSHNRHIFSFHKNTNGKIIAENPYSFLFFPSIYPALFQPSFSLMFFGVPCFIGRTRDSRVNSRRAQRVSLRGLTLTHLCILHISRPPLPQLPSKWSTDIRTYFAVISIALTLRSLLLFVSPASSDYFHPKIDDYIKLAKIFSIVKKTRNQFI